MAKLSKISKKTIPVVGILILCVIVGIGTAYGEVKAGDLPIKMPFIETIEYYPEVPDNAQTVMNQWRNFIQYVPPEEIRDMSQIINDDTIVFEKLTKDEFQIALPIIDGDTLQNYINGHPDVIKDGYEKLFIDNVDYMNTPTGIKTINGDDVLAIDIINRIVIIGRDIVSDSGTSKVKIALVYGKDNINLSLVKNLNYWDIIEKHAVDNEAVLAINASGYNWNNSGSYATVYGAIRYEGETFRKAANEEEYLGFDENRKMTIGENIDNSYFGVEALPVLIKDGVEVYETNENESRNALTAIGQTDDGVTILVVGSGGAYGSGMGVTYTDILNVIKDFKATNAAILSGGTRTIMYWNGRVVNETVGYSQDGVKLPNTIYVKYRQTDKKEDTE